MDENQWILNLCTLKQIIKLTKYAIFKSDLQKLLVQ